MNSKSLLALILVPALAISGCTTSQTETLAPAILEAQVQYNPSDSSIEIININDFEWTDVAVTINDKWTARLATAYPNEYKILPTVLFMDQDGDVMPFQIVPQKIKIEANEGSALYAFR